MTLLKLFDKCYANKDLVIRIAYDARLDAISLDIHDVKKRKRGNRRIPICDLVDNCVPNTVIDFFLEEIFEDVSNCIEEQTPDSITVNKPCEKNLNV